MSLAQTVQSIAFARYLRWVRSSSDVRIEGAPRESVMVTLWHEYMLCGLAATCGLPNMAVYVWDQPGMEEMISLLRRLGLAAIVANAGNGYGVRELREWFSVEGRIVAITLDGPAGPRRVAKPGVVRLARLARVSLHPLQIVTPIAFEMPTWDRCLVPSVDGTMRLRLIDALPTDATPAEAARAIERQLNSTHSAYKDNRVTTLGARLYARLCTMPLECGKLTVWPESPAA